MAKAFIYFKAELSSKQDGMLETKIKGRTIEFSVDDGDLDMDGKFADTAMWDPKLWDTILTAESALKGGRFPKPSLIKSNLEEPGTYELVVEWEKALYKGKIKIKGPQNSDPTKRAIKRGTKPPHVKVIATWNW